MKKIHFLSLSVILAVTMVFGGCSIDKVNPPATTTTAAAPTTIQVSLSSSTIANSGTTNVTATVTNASSVVMPNVSVSFSVISSTAGSFNPASAVTNASGQATSVFTAGAAVNATATIRASVTVGTSTISGTAPITIGTPPQVPTTVVVSLGTTTIGNGGNTTVSATVLDASSLPINGQTVTFSVSALGAVNFTPAATATTNASGVATVTVTAVSTNTFATISATVGTLNNSATLAIGIPTSAPAASMTLTVTPQQVNITNQATASVTLLTATGGPAYDMPVILTITSGTFLASFSTSTLVSAVTVTTNSSGTASATIYTGTSSGVVTISATSGALSKTASINITSDPASISLTIVNPSLVNGQNTNITASVLNAANQPVSDGTTVTFTLLSTGSAPGQLSSATAFTVNGIASVTFTASTTNTGPVFVTASAGTTTPVTDTKMLTVSASQAGSILFVSAEPQIIGIYQSGTQDTSVVTFQVLNSVGAPLANQSVDFTIAIGPVGATLDTGGGSTSSGSTNANGEVSTILHSGTVAGPVRIVATTVAPGPPAVTLSTSSGNISIGGGVPSARWLSLSASKLNIDGAGCDGVETTINARLADRFGNYNILKGTSVSFAAEGGAINASNVTDDNGVASVVFRSQEPRPTNGRVSVLVMTTGEEAFFDANSNGVFDGVDTFTDIPEPFIDSDESGVWEAGELFFDWPLSVPTSTMGSYNSANGVWDAQIPIFSNIYILLTGPPFDGATFSRIETSPTGTADVNLGNGGSQVFTIYVSDASGNSPKSGTTVSIKASKGTLSTSSVTIPDTNGSGPYRINVRLTGPSCSTPPCAPETGTLSADISWTGTCGGALTLPIFYPGAINIY